MGPQLSWDSHTAFSPAGKVFLQWVKILSSCTFNTLVTVLSLTARERKSAPYPAPGNQEIKDGSWVTLSFSSISKLNLQFLQDPACPKFEYIHYIDYHGLFPVNILLLVNVTLKMGCPELSSVCQVCSDKSKEEQHYHLPHPREALHKQMPSFKPSLFLPASYLSSLSLSSVLQIFANIPYAGHHTNQ